MDRGLIMRKTRERALISRANMIVQYLREKRLDKDMTQGEMGAATHMTRMGVGSIEAGRSRLSTDLLLAWLDTLGMKLVLIDENAQTVWSPSGEHISVELCECACCRGQKGQGGAL